MTAATDRYAAASAAIDAVNADDPTSVVVQGEEVPTALAQGRLAVRWVEVLDPAADDVRLLAARAHHLRRWASPRSEHPEGRAGYLRWRAAAKRRHAEEVGALLAGVGYGPDEIERVGSIIRKEGLGTDPAVQVHEDALCLVFLATQLDGLAADIGPERMIQVLQKTAAKMSPAGMARLPEVDLSVAGRELVAEALAPG